MKAMAKNVNTPAATTADGGIVIGFGCKYCCVPYPYPDEFTTAAEDLERFTSQMIRAMGHNGGNKRTNSHRQPELDWF
jgi:hypothetical protein